MAKTDYDPGRLCREFEAAHPEDVRTFRALLRQSAPGSSSVVYGIFGDPKAAREVAEKEAQVVHPEGALVIDCRLMDARDLFFSETPVGGAKYGKGPVWQAMDAGRPVILDNFSQMKEGTTSIMLMASSVLSGNSSEVQLLDKSGNAAVLARKDVADRFRLRLTGLPDGDGGSGKGISVALQNRIGRLFVATP